MYNDFVEILSNEEINEVNAGGLIYDAFYWLGHKVGSFRIMPDSNWNGGLYKPQDNN